MSSKKKKQKNNYTNNFSIFQKNSEKLLNKYSKNSKTISEIAGKVLKIC